MKLIKGMALVALLAVGTFGFAQDAKKDEAKKDGCCKEEQSCCGDKQDGCSFIVAALHKELCGGKAECKDEKCAVVCKNVTTTLQAVGARCMEACKKEGLKCEGCEKDAKSAPCGACKDLCVKTFVPWLKTQMTTKDATHSSKDKDGKEVSVKCTLTTGPACEGCVDALSTAMLKACREACKSSAKKS